jgi:hypothetical protein
MHRTSCLALSLAIGTLSIGEAATDPLQNPEYGRDYHTVRRDLIQLGDTPVNQTNLPHSFCSFGDEEAETCQMYPEVLSCAVDRPLCRFEWRAKTGQRFYIITSGEYPNSLTVVGWDFDDAESLKSGEIK